MGKDTHPGPLTCVVRYVLLFGAVLSVSAVVFFLLYLFLPQLIDEMSEWIVRWPVGFPTTTPLKVRTVTPVARTPGPYGPPPTAPFEIAYRPTMSIDSQAIVTAEVIANPDGSTATLTCQKRSDNGAPHILETTTALYPIMRAELLAPNFHISPTDADPRRVVTSTIPAWWVWTIAPTKPGPQELSVNLYGESAHGDSTGALASAGHVTFEILVEDKPFLHKLQEASLRNFDLVALVTAGAAVLASLGVILHQRSTTSALSARLDALEKVTPNATGSHHSRKGPPPTSDSTPKAHSPRADR